MTPKPQRLDGYIRVSRVGSRDVDSDSYQTEDIQREAIERWAAYKGVTVAEWHTDRDQSGGTHERPGLEAAIERAVRGDTAGIICWKIDRFSRMTEHGLRDLRALEAADARLVFTVEDLDTSGPMGRFVYRTMLSQAEFFLDNIKAGWHTAKTRATARGAKIGPTPFGYRRVKGEPLEPHPKEAPVIRMAYKLAGSVGGVQRAMSYLRQAAPDRRWTTATVRRLLKNRTYLGEIHYGNQTNHAAHPALVDERTWQLAQSEGESRSPNDSFPLSGLPECGTCGSPMVGSRGGRDPATGRGYRMYRCGADTALRRGECLGPVSVTAERLEVYLRVRVVELLEAAQQNGDRDVLAPRRRLATAEKALKAAENELVLFASDTAARTLLGEDTWQAGLAARAKARDDARAANALAIEQARVQHRPTLGKLRKAEGEELGRLLRGAVSRVVVVKGRGDIENRVTIHLHETEAP